MAGLAQDESRRISERVQFGVLQSMKRGVAFGNYMYGYNFKNGQLEIIPEEAKIIKEIFSLYLEGLGAYSIAKRLKEEQVPIKRPIKSKTSTNWDTETILGILKNVKYAGDLKQRITYTTDFLEHSKKFNKGEVDFIEIKDHHEPIIDRATFDAVQQELARRSAIYKVETRKYSNRHELSNKIVCGRCGNGYVVGVGKVRKDGTRRLSWRCHTAVLYGKKHIVDNHEMGCDNQRVGDDTLKECFFKIMSKLKINQKEVEKRVISELKISMDKCNDNMMDVNLLENTQNKLEREKSRLLDLYLGEYISKEDFNIKNNELIDKMNKNTKELKNLQLKQNLQQDLDEIFKKIVDRIKYVLSFKEYNNNVIEELIDKVVIDDKQHFKYYIKGIQDPIFATEMGVISSQPHLL